MEVGAAVAVAVAVTLVVLVVAAKFGRRLDVKPTEHSKSMLPPL
jgi:hypothetical protein